MPIVFPVRFGQWETLVRDLEAEVTQTVPSSGGRGLGRLWGREGVNAKALLDMRFHSNFLLRCWESAVVVCRQRQSLGLVTTCDSSNIDFLNAMADLAASNIST